MVMNKGNKILIDLVVVGIERVLPRGDDMLRKTREAYWINQYESTTYVW